MLVYVKNSSYLVPTLNPSKAHLGLEPTKGQTLGSQRSDPCPEAVRGAEDINLYEVTIGKPVQTKEVATRLADLSALSPGECYSMLGNLGKVLGEFMNSGRTVKLDGVGTFYYTPNTQGQGVDTAEEVSAKQIVGTRVRFIPETTRSVNNQITTRSLVSENTFWEELKLDSSASSSTGGAPGSGEEGSFG